MIPCKTTTPRLPKKIRLTEPFSSVAEIRIRVGRPAVCVNIFGDMSVCSEPFTAGETEEFFAEICRYSVHSFQEDIARGFVTLDGGHRVGICGTAVTENGRIAFIKDISGLNIRVAHQISGCSDEIFKRFFTSEKGGLCSLLIAGKPLSGKTTILRDLARSLGERRRVTIIDSRNEISASVRGMPSLDVGLNTDVLCGCGKSEGIMLALRSLSPEVIICDEIAHDEDAVEQALFCGVKIIAAAHAASLKELDSRFGVSENKGLPRLFDANVVIGERGKIIEERGVVL